MAQPIRFVTLSLLLAGAPGMAATHVVDNAHPKAADTNPGTREAPLKTISAAAAKVQPGDEVVVRPGIYREAVTLTVSGKEGQPITFRSEVPLKAVVSGADLYTDWKAEEKGVWSHPIPKTWKVTYLGGNPQWIYVNGLPLERAETRDRIIPGTFFQDLDGLRVYVSPPEGLDLAGATVEYACREGLFCPKEPLDDIRIVGFTLRQNAGWFRGSPALRVSGRRWLVEANHILWTSYTGFQTTQSSRCVVRNNTIEWCGCQGIGGGSNANLLVEGNTIRYNNWRRFPWGNEGGGSKWAFTLDSRVKGNVFAYNFGPGIWFDGANAGNIYEQNICHDNTVRALFAEISWDEIIQDNIVYNTLESAILSSRSPGVLIRRNAVFNNGIGIGLGGNYTRANDHGGKAHADLYKKVASIPDIDPTRLEQWDADYLKYWVAPRAHMLNNCLIWDNLIFDNAIGVMEGRDYRTASRIDGFVNNLSDHNLYWTAKESSLFNYQYQFSYDGLAAWQKASTRDEHSLFADPRDPATKLPEWAVAKRAQWDLKMRPVEEIKALNLGLVESAMAQIALGRLFRSPTIKPVALKDERIKAFLFQVDGERTLGLWTTQVAERRYVRLQLNRPTVTVESGYLAKDERRLANGAVDVLVTYNPTYLRGVGEQVVESPSGVLKTPVFNLADQPVPASVVFTNDGKTPAELRATFIPSAGYTVTPATVSRKLAPGERWEATLSLRPDGSLRRGAGMLRMEATLGEETMRRVAVFTVGEGENKLPTVDPPPVIDGKIDDWGPLVALRVPLGMVGDAGQCISGDKAKWAGPDDLSARVYAAWTKEALYAAVVVTDDRVVPCPAGGNPDRFDAIAFSLDGRAADMQWQRALTRGCYHAVISPSAGGQALVKPTWEARSISGVTTASAVTPTGYVIEMKIPLTEANFPAGEWSPGRPVKLSVLVADTDEPAGGDRKHLFGWRASPNGDNASDTSGWATVLLEK